MCITRRLSVRFFVLAGALIVIPASARATCAVGIYTREGVVLATDSLEIRSDGMDRRRTCKIRRTDHCAVTAAGRVSNTSTGYDLMELAFQICSTSTDFWEALKVFRHRVQAGLELELAYDSANSRARKDGDILSKTMIASVQSSGPVLVYIEHIVIAGHVQESVYREVIQTKNSTGILFVACKRAPELVRKNTALLRLSPVELVRALIESEIANKPAHTLASGPITVLQLRNRTEWLSQGVCEIAYNPKNGR
jgi:hypothetical protein